MVMESPTAAIVADPLNMPDGITAYVVEFESEDGGSELVPVAATNISECAKVAQRVALESNTTVKLIVEWGYELVYDDYSADLT